MNLYHLLGLTEKATLVEIEKEFERAQQDGSLNLAVLEKVEQCLLNPHNKAEYDLQLKKHFEQEEAALDELDDIHMPTTKLSQFSFEQSNLSMKSHEEEPELKTVYKKPEHLDQILTRDDLIQATVGVKQSAYYLQQFHQLETGKKASFNWAAFFGGGAWFCARGMWKLGLILVGLSLSFALVIGLGLNWFLTSDQHASNDDGALLTGSLLIVLLYLVLRWVWLPFKANEIYAAFVQQKTTAVRRKYFKQPNTVFEQLNATTNIPVGWLIFVMGSSICLWIYGKFVLS